MKRCPQCNRVETDDALKFCRTDGTLLVAATASESESATIALPASRPSEEITTGRLRVSPSIAVLPFANMSTDPENEYFCDGLAEELLNALAKIENLKVAARTSSFSFKAKNANVDEIGRALHVNSVLEGSVRKSGNRLRITVQLINATDGYHLWSERYDREMQDIFDVQDEITLAVVGALKVKLLGEERAVLLKRYTDSTEAYELYLKGRYYWNRRTAENIKKAIEQFKVATDHDPNYALAYAGLADCYALLNQYAGTPLSKTVPQAKAYAERAIAIDDQLAEPHASLGRVTELLWQWTVAEREFKRAIELNPNYATAYHWYSLLLRTLGRFDEAAVMIKRAQEIDPLSSMIGVNVSITYQSQNDHVASIENTRKIIELDPNFSVAYEYLGLSYLKKGCNAEAIASFEKAVELSNRAGEALLFLGYGYGVTGRHAEAIAVAKELEGKYAKKETSGRNVAAVYAGLGEKDKAFEWLEKDFQTKGDLQFIRWEIPFESLRDDSRFKDLLKRMGLPE